MPLVPHRIDRYDIKGRIGGGGMGTLYLARDTNPATERLVALKLLRTSFDSDDLRLRFLRESQALAELSHPNIVVIYDSGEFEDLPFIVMEYVRGESLAESIKRKAPMALGQKLRLLSELCAGLAHAHEAGIIHRDIKPANLMVDLHGRLKILDFGIARMEAGTTLGAAPLTRLNVQIGTPGYMSPEQIETGQVDARSDLFSVGAVAYEFISYREAFPGVTTRQIENKVLGEQPVPLASSIEGLDPGVVEIIAGALEKDPSRRCQSAVELAHAFERARARLGEDEVALRPTPRRSISGGERKSRHARAADAAYERAVASYQDGAEAFARRSAMEAIAEDPRHAGARQLLVELGHVRDVEPWLPSDLQQPTLSSAPVVEESSRTMLAPTPGARVSPSRPAAPIDAPAGPATLLAGADAVPAESGALLSVPGTGLEGVGEGPVSGTRVATPAPVPAPAPGPAKKPTPPRADARAKQRPAGLSRALRLSLVVGGIVVALGGLAGAGWWLWWKPPAEEILSVARPTGGTIEGDGIACGTGGSQCEARPRRGSTMELRAVADAGFVFAGFSGDCAPAGRAVMTAARSCGASFVAEAPPPPAEPGRQLLTIGRPTGGTIEGPGIRCGTSGADCSLNQPEGAEVKLTARPDKGFAFGGFTGDCAPGGTTVMSGPRRCGATFTSTSAPPAQAWVLTITKPTGGTILGDQIKCGTADAACTARFPAGASVALSYAADRGYKFAGFVGDCGPDGKTVMSQARTCGATFAREAEPVQPGPYVLTVRRSNQGTVIGNGIDCGPSTALCVSPQPSGVTARLAAFPAAGFHFEKFTEDCSAGGEVAMSAARSCGVSFTRDARSLRGRDYAVLTIVRPRNATVLGTGIECGPASARCAASQPVGSTVHLRVRPEPGFVFVRFNGECDGGGTASMGGARTCAASILGVKDQLAEDMYPLLTIARPRDGTIVGSGIECGTSAEQCSARQPAGVGVYLVARPDPGFVFARFTGDCDAGGSTVMTGRRTCGAIFVKPALAPLKGSAPRLNPRSGRQR